MKFSDKGQQDWCAMIDVTKVDGTAQTKQAFYLHTQNMKTMQIYNRGKHTERKLG